MKTIIRIAVLGLKLLYGIMKLLPTRNKITMISRQSDEITADFALIRMRAEELLPGYRIRILTRRLQTTPAGVIGYCLHILRQMIHIATSRFVLLDSFCIPVSILRHKKSLTIIQMWHAMGLMKNAGKNALGKKEGRDPSLAEVLHMHEGYDYIFASSEVCREPISRVFGYPAERTIVMALPITDLLRDPAATSRVGEEIARVYDLDRSKKTILYAPTFRASEQALQRKLDEFTDAVDFSRYNLFVKPHALSNITPGDPRVIVDRRYSSIEIAMACDYVITDYSSVIYEVLILGKPLFFYAFDVDEYIQNRGFFINYKTEIPGTLHAQGANLFEAIRKGDWDVQRQQAFLTRYVKLPETSAVQESTAFIQSVAKSA